jgi:hypothetical protein
MNHSNHTDLETFDRWARRFTRPAPKRLSDRLHLDKGKIPDRGEKVAVINKSAIKNKNAIKTEPMGVTRLLKINRMVIVETLIPLCWAITSTLSSYQYSTHTK